jgi:hypothetical protein
MAALRTLLPLRTDLVLVFNSRWDQMPEWEVALSCAARAPELLARILDMAEGSITLVGVEGVHPGGRLVEDARPFACKEWRVGEVSLAEWRSRPGEEAALEI